MTSDLAARIAEQLANLKNFDVGGATATLWVFKTRTVEAGKAPVFTGRWVETADALDEALKAAVEGERNRISEIVEYGLLAETNESSALSITATETHANLIVDQAVGEIVAKKARKLQDLQNTSFYAIKLVHEDEVLYAVKKVGLTWRTKRAGGIIAVYFSDNRLELDEHPGFEIAKSIDFFIHQGSIIISDKRSFESVLNFKTAHKEAFLKLQTEAEFVAIFSNMQALLTYIGENKIQLRRAMVIQQKGHYKDPSFMKKLVERHAEFGLNIAFDPMGRIQPSAETCRDIMQALLDHRLTSGFSTNVYDVPDASKIAV